MTAAAALDRSKADLEKLLRRPGRPRKAPPITLADVRELPDPKARVRASKVVLELGGDPLGIRTGQYGARKKWGVGDATPQRMAHARTAGQRIVTEKETFEDGRETGLPRKRLISKLELLRSRWRSQSRLSPRVSATEPMSTAQSCSAVPDGQP